MNREIAFLVNRLCDSRISETSIIPWGSPIPSFGDLYSADFATVGINPSNKEFVDSNLKELSGVRRRFPTLSSLGLSNWADANETHFDQILDSCKNYFDRNPYDWFKKLDFVISGTNRSYYFPSGKACHLDLIPYATLEKWGNLTSKEKSLLLDLSGDTLGVLLRSSAIELLVLNGGTVVDLFGRISDVSFSVTEQPTWSLPRESNDDVVGVSYEGRATSVGGVGIGREIRVVGYNHNIQSSFGVTTKVLKSIRQWISAKAR